MHPTSFHDQLREIALTKGAQTASAFAVNHLTETGHNAETVTEVVSKFNAAFDALNEAVRWTAFHENQKHYIDQL